MDEGKVLLITGASSDVGVQLIKNIEKKYDQIWAHYNNSIEDIRELRQEIGKKIIPIQADFSSLESTQHLIDVIKESDVYPDHVVHLPAQKARNLQFHKHTWNNYQEEIDISLRSITMILQAFIPRMSKRKYGKIVFMLSAYVIGIPPKFQSAYITVKYALLGLMRNLASEYAPKGVMVNAVSPDMMETKFLSELPGLILEQSAKNNPLGRNIRVNEVVPTIMYLLSSASDIVTGQNIGVTGGGEIT